MKNTLIVRTCVYDNPVTMSRECWSDGNLVARYHFVLLEPFAKQKIPEYRFFFGANIGPWNAGQIVGDKSARLKNVVE